MSTASQSIPSLVFTTLIEDPPEIHPARLLVASLRTFGGKLSQSPVWIFTTLPPADFQEAGLTDEPKMEIIPLAIPADSPRYPFLHKVQACAQAETRCPGSVSTLVWINPECLVIKPPLAFELYPPYQAALRPVHLRNIGSRVEEPLDTYWGGIYDLLGINETPYTIQSSVDQQHLRPYYNTHCFSCDPHRGLMAAWQDLFVQLITNPLFQAQACQEPLQRIFLHQAALSCLLVQRAGQAGIRMLPPTYSYPLHLHTQIPAHLQANRLDDLVVAVYEETKFLNALPASDPLRAWLAKQELPADYLPA